MARAGAGSEYGEGAAGTRPRTPAAVVERPSGGPPSYAILREVTAAQFDVFLSYNRRDERVVESLAERLQAARVQPWLDKWSLVPGASWQRELVDALRSVPACAVLVGPEGLGDWAREELAVAQDRAAKDAGFRLFMVLLPGAPEPFDPSLAFLATRTWVDLRAGIDGQRPLQELVSAVWGIRRGTVAPDGDAGVCSYRELEPSDDTQAGLGLRQLKDDVVPQRPQLQATPGAAASTKTPSNLPPSRSSFVGRDTERRELGKLLAAPGLVTILGPGGVGKTRLGLEVAAGVRDRFPDGVFFIQLAKVTEPSAVAQAVAEPLGVRGEPGKVLLEALAQHVARRQLLLVLDNCEHVVEGSAGLADAMLDASPASVILATSREPLRIPGERVFPLRPLPLPQRDDLGPEALNEVDAVRLFCDRALAQGPFTLTPDNASAVARLCRRLDGMPLAIELAAARSRTLSPAQMLPMLDDRFALLTTGARTVMPRHQTLRAAVEWSHNLLGPAERTIFRRLAVFAGSFSLDAATAVCSDHHIDRNHVVDLVASLTDHSLVVPLDIHGERRFGFLETLHAYAEERLAEAGEEAAIRARFFEWALSFAESFADELEPRRIQRAETLDRLGVENENVRHALRWGISADPPTALRLFAAMAPFWNLGGYFKEVRRWADALLSSTPDAPPQLRARVLHWAGRFAINEGYLGRARPLLAQSLEIVRDTGDTQSVAHTLGLLSWIANDHLCDLEEGARLQEEVVALYAREEDDHLYSEALGWLAINTARRGDLVEAKRMSDESFAYNLRHLDDPCPEIFVSNGWVALLLGNLEQARQRLERAVAQTRAVGSRGHLPDKLGRLGEVALVSGNDAEALDLFTEHLAAAREIGGAYEVQLALQGLARVAIRRGEPVNARTRLVEALRILLASGRALLADDLEPVAALLALEGRAEDAARVLGAAELRREQLGTPLPPPYVAEHERLVATVASALDSDRFSVTWEAGRCLSPPKALAIAFDAVAVAVTA